MLQAVLKEGISKGDTRVQADNLYVVGNDVDSTIDNWERNLKALDENNLKLKVKKTKCFPDKHDLLGWIKEGKYLTPDPHRQNTIVTAELPTTVKDLRSYLGSYNTFYRCKKNLSLLLHNLSQLTSNDKSSNSKIPWTDELIETFKHSQKEAAQMDRLYIPKPEDQLVITQDYCKKGQSGESGLSPTLWAILEEERGNKDLKWWPGSALH